MSPKPSKAAKKYAKKPTARSKSPSAPKSAAKKAAKPEKKLPKKKAAAPSASAAKAKTPKAAAPRPTKLAKTAEAAKASKAKKATAPKATPAASAAKKKPAVTPIGIAKPGLGHKWSCFNCGAKFYDLGKPIPVCPKCEADQRDRPPVVAEAVPTPPQVKRPAMAPMSRFLDDDEVAAPEPDEFGVAPVDESEEPEATEIDIDSLEEPSGLAVEGDFNDAEEE